MNEAAERGEFDMEEIKASVDKILEYKKKLCYDIDPSLCNLEADRDAVGKMARQAITCCEGAAPLADENTFFCGCADYRASGVGNEDGSAGTFADYMARAFSAPSLITSKDPDEAEIQEVVRQAEKYGQIIFNTCNGHLFRGQIALAEALAKTGKPLTVVALRNPYYIPMLPGCACRIAAYDYTTPVFMALEEVFRGGKMTGVLPVKL